MNRIILVGNGFDLAHGLPTRYEDFIDWYWEQWFDTLRCCSKKTASDNLCTFELNVSHELWYTHISYCYSPILNRPKGKDFIEEIRKHPSVYTINECRFFEEIRKSIHEKNWVDIENEYYKFLSSFLKDSPQYPNSSILNNELDFIKTKLIEYLTFIQETQIQNLQINNTIKKNILSPFDPKDISVSAKKTWIDFIIHRCNMSESSWEVLLSSYFKEGILNKLNIINSFQKDASNIIEQIEMGIFPEEKFPQHFLLPDRIMLLNFNYTKTADTYLPKARCFTTNHIHGELQNPQSVIFGYGDELDDNYQKLLKLNENEYLRNMKSIRYLESSNYRNMLSFIESSPYQVYIMGHSCGNSDRTLLNTLFEHKNCVSIKPFYYRKEDDSDNYLEIVQNICRNFTSMQLMRDKVVNKTFCTPIS